MITLALEGKKMVADGDSITEGYLATAGLRWSSLLASERNGVEENFGIGGAGMQQAITTLGCGRAAFNLSRVPTKTSAYKYYFLAYGTNDLIVNRPGLLSVSAYQTELTAAVEGIKAKGWGAGDIVIVSGYYFPNLSAAVGECGVTVAPTRSMAESYRQAAISVAKAKNTVLADVYGAMQFAPNLNSLFADGLHPNNSGHRFIASYLEALDYTPQTSVVVTPTPASYAVDGEFVII
ncbi:MAG TPA: SGNH/GDSL hydrolase family protein [Fibrella sp.]|jgi:lysophospholipase L1-like esterase